MNNKRPLGVTVFGMGNVIFSLFFLVGFSFSFFMGVILGWVADRKFYGFLDWLFLSILDRIALAIFYFFSFLFFSSGRALLRMEPSSRKLAIVTSVIIVSAYLVFMSTSIISSFVYPQVEIVYQSPWVFMLPLFLIYTIFLITYLNGPEIKKQFNDEDVRLSFKKPIIFIIISFIFPLILSWLFSVYDLLFR